MTHSEKIRLSPDNRYSVVTRGVVETESLGRRLAALLRDNPSLPRYVALFGDSPKTSFVRGFVSNSTARSNPRPLCWYRNTGLPAPAFRYVPIEGETTFTRSDITITS